MATKKVGGVDPSEVPEGGSVTFKTQVSKEVAEASAEPAPLRAEDFEEAEWWIEKQGPGGWAWRDTFDGRPYPPDLRDEQGPGKYKVTPIGADGRPIAKLADIITIQPTYGSDDDGDSRPPDPLQAGGGDVPPVLAMLMKQNEEANQRLQAQLDRMQARDEERKAEVAQSEYERKLDRERRDDRKMELFGTLLSGGMAMAQSIATAMMSRRDEGGSSRNDRFQELLLERAFDERHSRRSEGSGNSMRDNLELLTVLDNLADRRAEQLRGSGGSKDSEEDGLMKMMSTIAPMMMMMRGAPAGAQIGMQGQPPAGAGVVPPPQLPANIVASVLQDADALKEAASAADPEAAARALLDLVDSNPALEAAIARLMKEAQDEEE